MALGIFGYVLDDDIVQGLGVMFGFIVIIGITVYFINCNHIVTMGLQTLAIFIS